MVRVAVAACLLVVPALAFSERALAGEPAAGSGSGSGTEGEQTANAMPAFRSSSSHREDANVDFDFSSADGDMQPSMDFTTQVNPTVSSKDLPLAAPQHRGTLKPTQVDSVLRTAFPQTLHCYRAMASAQKVEIVTTFVIAADGSVIDARIESMSLASPSFETCMRGVLMSLVFPQPDGNGIVEVRTPFTFYP
jgi:hypothetical protein